MACAIAGTVACTDGPAAPKVLDITGRLERGDTIVVHPTTDDGQGVTLSVTPANNATVLSDTTLLLRVAGHVTIQIHLADGTTASQTVTVAAPPSIVFDLSVQGNRDIYRAAIDGGELTRLTTAGGDDVHPSAAGGTVVFTSFRDGNAELYTVPLTGGQDHRVTTSADTSETEPSLSFDGQRIAYVSTARNGVAAVWLIARDGSNARALLKPDAATSGAPQVSPAWGPDGQVLFVGTTGSSADLYTAPADSAPTMPTAVASANSAFAEVDGAWSVDGDRLAFVSDRSGSTQLYVVRPSGSGQDAAAHVIDLAGSGIGQPTWLSDGRIVFATFRAGTWQLHWIDPVALDGVHDIPLPAGDPQHPSAAR